MQIGMTLGVPNNTYHADRKAVSSTWLKIISQKTPFHLRSYLDSPPAAATPALIMGSAVDCLIFEPDNFRDHFVVAPECDRRTTAGKATWAEVQAEAGSRKQVLKMSEHLEALQTAASVRSNPVMGRVLQRGVAQPTFVWNDPVTGMLCKCRPDWYDEEDGTIYDLKTAIDASPAGFAKAVANYGYHIQQAFYSDGLRVLGHKVRRFVFGVQEKPDGRHTQQADARLMAFYQLSEEDDDAGRDAYSSALAAISFCQFNDEWAGYTNDIVTLSRPSWAKAGDMEVVTRL